MSRGARRGLRMIAERARARTRRGGKPLAVRAGSPRRVHPRGEAPQGLRRAPAPAWAPRVGCFPWRRAAFPAGGAQGAREVRPRGGALAGTPRGTRRPGDRRWGGLRPPGAPPCAEHPDTAADGGTPACAPGPGPGRAMPWSPPRAPPGLSPPAGGACPFSPGPAAGDAPAQVADSSDGSKPGTGWQCWWLKHLRMQPVRLCGKVSQPPLEKMCDAAGTKLCSSLCLV